MQRKALAIFASALLIGGLTTGCSNDTSSTAPSAEVVTTAPGKVSLVGAEAFSSTINAGGSTVLDVRTPDEFASGHIDGAVNIDLNAPEFADQIAGLDPAQTYAVYCRSGNRSATATAYMVDQGFASVLELDGGVIAWDEAGLPLVS